MSHLILHFQLFSPQGGKKQKKTWWPHKHQVAQISYLERNMTLHCVHLWHDIYLPTWSNYCIYTTMEWAWVVGSFGVGRWLWRQILFQIIRRVVRSHRFLFLLILDINFRGVDLIIIFGCYFNVLIVYSYRSCGTWSLIDTLLCHGSK